MFDIGWSELLVVLVVALVVVGPKDLPRLMRTVGRWVGRARAMADQFRSSFDEMARETELDELRQEIQALRSNNPLTRAVNEISKPLASATDDVNRSILPPDALPEPIADDVSPEAAADEAIAADIHGEPAGETEAPQEIQLPPDSKPPAS